MRTALVRRTVLTASAASLALLATACGSSGTDKADAKPSASAPASSSAAAAKALTDAELAKLLLAQGDVPDHTVKAATAADMAAATAGSDKPECKVLVQTQSFTPAGTPAGTARTKVVANPKAPAADASEEEKAKAALGAALSTTATAVTLASYEGKGAEEAFAALKTAGEKCAGGYTATQDGEAAKVSKVAPGAALTAGDQALALAVDIDGDTDGKKITTQLVVVRKGNTVATFSALSLAGTAEQPKAVIDAQVKKLG